MPERMIHESALASETLGALSHFAERLFWRLIPVTDDFGRFNAALPVIAGRCLTYVSTTPKQIEAGLAELAECGAIVLYEVEGKRFGYFPSWNKYQRRRSDKSKFPDPPQSAAICGEALTDDNKCGFARASKSQSNTDPDPDPDLNLSSEGESEGEPEKPEPLTPEELCEGWNEFCEPLGLPKVEMLSPSRKEKARSRIREHADPEFWRAIFAAIRGSPFLLGHKNGDGKHKKWKVDFDWLIANDVNCVKIYEGKYVGE